MCKTRRGSRRKPEAPFLLSVLFDSSIAAKLCRMSETLYDTWMRDHAGDFAAGVALLARHGGSPALTRLAWERLQIIAGTGGSADAYNLGKLESALRSLTSLTPGPSPVERGAVAPDATVNVAAPLSPGEGPGVRPNDRTRALHKLHSHHHALLVAAATDDERATHAHAIMREILPALDAEYDRLRANLTPDPSPVERGAVESPLSTGEGSGVRQIKRLASLRTRIARLKNHLIPGADDKKRRATLEKELAEKTAEKEVLEKELSA